MKFTVEITPDELNQAAIIWLKSKGINLPDGIDISVVISKLPAVVLPPIVIPPPPVVPPPLPPGRGLPGAKTPSMAPIGRVINGVKVTRYGYPGDSTPDTNSMSGIGDGHKLVSNLSVGLSRSYRVKLFGASICTGREFDFDGFRFKDDDTAPESDERIDVYDPYYEGRDPGCTDQMYARSRDLMVKAGILT